MKNLFFCFFSVFIINNSFAAEISKDNNTQIDRSILDKDSCNSSSLFNGVFEAYIHGSSNPDPTSCTYFSISPYMIQSSSDSIVKSANSTVDLSYLIKSSKIETVSAISIYFYTSPLTSSSYSINIPMDINSSWIDNNDNNISAPSIISSTSSFSGPVTVSKIAVVSMYTSDSGKNWKATVSYITKNDN